MTVSLPDRNLVAVFAFYDKQAQVLANDFADHTSEGDKEDAVEWPIKYFLAAGTFEKTWIS